MTIAITKYIALLAVSLLLCVTLINATTQQPLMRIQQRTNTGEDYPPITKEEIDDDGNKEEEDESYAEVIKFSTISQKFNANIPKLHVTLLGEGETYEEQKEKAPLPQGFWLPSQTIDVKPLEGKEINYKEITAGYAADGTVVVTVNGYQITITPDIEEFQNTLIQARGPEPYKGKGIRFAGEEVRRKAGKTAGKR